jgi:hypothetical protein
VQEMAVNWEMVHKKVVRLVMMVVMMVMALQLV